MQQLEFFDIPSPCIGVCQTGTKGYCLGCYRSRDERLYWIQLDANAKRMVIKACALRKKRAQQRALLQKNSDPDRVSQQTLWPEDE